MIGQLFRTPRFRTSFLVSHLGLIIIAAGTLCVQALPLPDVQQTSEDVGR